MRNDSITGHFVLNEYAQRFNALIVSAEHRFYGDSIPTQDLSTENLRYLSSSQALADFAALVYEVKSLYNAADSKVVSFGGSYSGALSAWFRMKYPHIVHAALASSGPVLAQMDFPEYFEVVTTSLSPIGDCVSTITAATKYYTGLLSTSDGKKKIENDFQTRTPIVSDLDVTTFFGVHVGYYMWICSIQQR